MEPMGRGVGALDHRPFDCEALANRFPIVLSFGVFCLVAE